MPTIKVYLNKERETAVTASGRTVLELIDLGLQALSGGKIVDQMGRDTGSRVVRRADLQCPHPPARRAKGLCMACGTYVG